VVGHEKAEEEGVFRRLFGLDLRSLAAFRIALGALVLVDLFLRAHDLRAHYTDTGWLPREALADVPARAWHSSLHELGGSWEWAAALFLLHAALGLALLVGYRTRLAGLGVWLMTLSLQARNPMVLDGADMLLRHLMFWSLFVPLGARWSLDARRDPELTAAPGRVAGLATAALALQPVLLYEFAAMTKVQPEWISEGTGVYYALMLDQLVKPLGKWLLAFPDLLWGINWATLVWEYLGPLLLFSPWRTPRVRLLAMLGFVGLQLGFGQTIRLMLFPWCSTLALVPLLPSEFWDALARRWPGLAHPEAAGGPPLDPGPTANRVAGVLFLYTFLWNVQTLPEPPFRFPPVVQAPGYLLRLEQWWYLFAPPWKTDGWYVVEATLSNGRKVDLRTGEEVSYEKPASTYEAFDTHRTWAFYRFLGYPTSRELRGHFTRALRRDYAGSGKPVEVRLVYVMERTLPGGETAPLEKVLLYHEFRALGGGVRVRPEPALEDVPGIPGAPRPG